MAPDGLNEFVSLQWVWYDIKTGISSIICLFFQFYRWFSKVLGAEYLGGRKNTMFRKKNSQKVLKLMPPKFDRFVHSKCGTSDQNLKLLYDL